MLIRVIRQQTGFVAFSVQRPAVQGHGATAGTALSRLMQYLVDDLTEPLDRNKSSNLTLVLTPRYGLLKDPDWPGTLAELLTAEGHARQPDPNIPR